MTYLILYQFFSLLSHQVIERKIMILNNGAKLFFPSAAATEINAARKNELEIAS